MGRERTALLSNKYINTPFRCGLIGLFPTIAQIQAEHIVQMSGVFWLSILYACVEERCTRREKVLASQTASFSSGRIDK